MAAEERKMRASATNGGGPANSSVRRSINLNESSASLPPAVTDRRTSSSEDFKSPVASSPRRQIRHLTGSIPSPSRNETVPNDTTNAGMASPLPPMCDRLALPDGVLATASRWPAWEVHHRFRIWTTTTAVHPLPATRMPPRPQEPWRLAPPEPLDAASDWLLPSWTLRFLPPTPRMTESQRSRLVLNRWHPVSVNRMSLVSCGNNP